MDYFSPIQRIPDARLNRLTLDHTLKPFDCGRCELNSYLFDDCISQLKYLLSTTYLLETNDHTVAYFSVANDKLSISVNSSRPFKRLLRQKVKDDYLYRIFREDEFPAVKLSRIAVDGSYQKKGIGTELLDAIIFSFTINNKTGCTFLTVDAINEDIPIHFYDKNGFQFLSEKDRNEPARLMYRCLL
jgi:ribosomal protein S18 acetylase RimI-like enzyme